VPIAGINVNANLNMLESGANFAVVNASYFQLTPVTTGTVSSTSRALFVNSADNDLYYRTNGGTNIKLTNGATFNASLVGGIGGDYSSVSALLDYVDASDIYRLRQQLGAGVQQYARAAVAGLDLYEYFASGVSPVPTNRVRLASPAALAASYDVTWPAAVPGATSIVQMSAAGALSVSNTVANAVTLSALLTASAGVTCAANQHVTVSGSGRFKHGDQVLNLALANMHHGSAWSWVAAGAYSLAGGSGTATCDIPLPQGARIKSITFARYGDGAADLTTTVYKSNVSGAAPTSIGTTTDTNPAAAWGDSTIDVTDSTVDGTFSLYVDFAANAANIRVANLRVTYDWP